jgi:hypothetical protein
MLSIPEQSVKCFLNADLNGQLELDTKKRTPKEEMVAK